MSRLCAKCQINTVASEDPTAETEAQLHCWKCLGGPGYHVKYWQPDGSLGYERYRPDPLWERVVSGIITVLLIKG